MGQHGRETAAERAERLRTDAEARAETEEERATIKQAADTLERIAKGKGGQAFPLTDDGNVNRFLAVWRDSVLWCGSHGGGSFWVDDGRRWVEDRTNVVAGRARALVRAMDTELHAVSGADRRFVDWVFRSQSLSSQRTIVEGLKTRLGFDPDAFDPPPTDLWLNTPSLRVWLAASGYAELRDPSLHITRLTGVGFDPDEDCPRFRAAIDTWMMGRRDLVDYLQKVLGASLLPGLAGRLLVVMHGGSATGKTTLGEIMRRILGDYAGTLATEALMEQRSRASHDEALVPLIGRRFVFASEGSERQTWNAALVKLLTGGDAISLRRIYGRQTLVRPTWCMFLATNHAPSLANVDDAIRDRLRLIPFDHHVAPADRIPDLAEQLVNEEGSGILNWLLEGLWKAQAEGLGDPPRAVRELTDDYFDTADDLGRYLDERTVRDPNDRRLSVGSGQLYQDYTEWCGEEGVAAVSSTRFGHYLNEQKITRERDAGNRVVRRGIGLRLL